MRYVPDTNILIYFLENRLAQPFPSGQYAYSVITEIELLSWPRMQPKIEEDCRALLATMHRIELDARVCETTIALRRAHSLKLPDTLIAASALHFNAVLLTNDQRLLTIPGLRVQAVELRCG